MQERRQPEIVAGRVNADGSIAAGDGFTVTKGAAGTYTVAFPGSFRAVSVVAMPAGTASTVGIVTQNVGAVTGQAITVVVLNTAGNAIDGAFMFTAVGAQQ